MKSPQVQRLLAGTDGTEAARYSGLTVLRSAAGWYVGTIYTDEHGNDSPGSRDSDYFRTEVEATRYLMALEAGETSAIEKMRFRP